MNDMESFPSWHPAAQGEIEDKPGDLPVRRVPYEHSGTPYTGKNAPAETVDTPNTSRFSSHQQTDHTSPKPRQRKYREGYKKGFRRPKPNPKSPFAPAFGAPAEEETTPKKRATSQVQFREDSRLADNESTLIQGVTGRKRGRSQKEPESEFTQAKNIVLNQLAASAKSRAQLEKKLKEKEISEDVASDVLSRFEEVKLVNDEEFAQMYVRTRANVKKLSRTAIRRELKQKGVTGEMAEIALEQRSEEDERSDAHELVRKKIRPSMDFSDRKEKDKIMRRLVSMLARKGYPSSMAFSVVKDEIESYIQENGLESAESEDYFF